MTRNDPIHDKLRASCPRAREVGVIHIGVEFWGLCFWHHQSARGRRPLRASLGRGHSARRARVGAASPVTLPPPPLKPFTTTKRAGGRRRAASWRAACRATTASATVRARSAPAAAAAAAKRAPERHSRPWGSRARTRAPRGRRRTADDAALCATLRVSCVLTRARSRRPAFRLACARRGARAPARRRLRVGALWHAALRLLFGPAAHLTHDSASVRAAQLGFQAQGQCARLLPRVPAPGGCRREHPRTPSARACCRGWAVMGGPMMGGPPFGPPFGGPPGPAGPAGPRPARPGAAATAPPMQHAAVAGATGRPPPAAASGATCGPAADVGGGAPSRWGRAR